MINMILLTLITGAIGTCIAWIFFFKSRIRSFSMDGTMIKIARTTEECTDLINELQSHSPNIIGLDCEWSDDKVSLLQIGNCNLIIYFL